MLSQALIAFLLIGGMLAIFMLAIRYS